MVVVEQETVHVLTHFTDGPEYVGVDNFGSKCPVEALCGQARIHLDPQRLAVVVVHHIEHAEGLAVPQAVRSTDLLSLLSYLQEFDYLGFVES